jgi:SulP family sulfate permease
VQSVDVTAAHLLNQIRDSLRERGAAMLLSNVRENLPSGRNLREFLEQTGLFDDETVQVFPDLDRAIAWVEGRILGETETDLAAADEPPMNLAEMDLFLKHKDETLKDLEARMETRSYKAGETIYVRGQPGDEIYWIRRGVVFIHAPMGAGRTRHVASFGRGDFFGGLAFLDGQPRGNDAIASTDTEMYVLSREQFNQIAEGHKRLAYTLVTAMARTLALRLRHADSELAMLQEY